MLASMELLNPADFEEAQALIDRCMRPDSSLSMAEDFPLLVGPQARSRRLVVKADGRIVSHVASRTSTVKTPAGGLFRVANFGAVCSDPSVRGHGFAKKLMENQLVLAQSDGVDLAMLWSEVDGFYEQFGFEYAGRETHFAVSAGDVRNVVSIMARWLRPDDVPYLIRLRNKDECAFGRPHEEAQTLFHLPQSQTLVAVEGDRPRAYVVYGKGLDFDNAVCEWGGPARLVVPLLKTLMRSVRTESLLICGPSWDQDFVSNFSSLGCPSEETDVGMFKILNTDGLIESADPSGALMLPREQSALLTQLLGRAGHDQPTALPFYVWGLDSM